MGNLSHTLGTETSKRFQVSGQQPCLWRMVRKGKGNDKLPSSTLGVRINHCTFKALRRFHQRCLQNPGITWMLQGNFGPCWAMYLLLVSSSKDYLAVLSTERGWGAGCLALLSRINPEAQLLLPMPC